MLNFRGRSSRLSRLGLGARRSRSHRERGQALEYVLLIVLIAVPCILAFIFLGGSLRKQMALTVQKITGQVTSSTAIGDVDTSDLQQTLGTAGDDSNTEWSSGQ